MRKQTVLLFNTIYPTQTGGMEVYNYRLSNRILTGKTPNIILLLSDSSRVDNRRIFCIRNRIFGITRYGLGMLSVFVSCLISRHIHIRKWKTVMIPYTSNFEFNAWPVLLFSKLFGFKYVLHCHGGGAKEWRTPKLQTKLFRRASHVTAVSQKIIDEYEKRTGCKVEYLPPLMDYKKSTLSKEEAKKQFGLEKYDKIVLYVGSVKHLKSPETLLKAFSSLPDDYVKEKRIGLVMAGGGELLMEMQSKYSSNSNIHILGAVKNELIKDLYAAADIYVICSWFEGTPLALMEAMYNGLCCIGTKVQGIDAILEDKKNGLLFQKDDDKVLRELLQKCLNDDDLALRLGKNAQEFYNTHYSYDNHLKKVFELLDYSKN
ncbi:MAG: glycosyltransferase family 4 protein [Paludibacteraceae bacterium]|nr:glycosyltransferase family 4 protein [Paludibacteraceae bacterium]MBP5664512.1 glycosyltransferase family 4 protein [Bacteroidales bacterium]